jgi:hypothetical protein
LPAGGYVADYAHSVQASLVYRLFLEVPAGSAQGPHGGMQRKVFALWELS